MKIMIDTTAGSITVEGGDDCKRLDASATGTGEIGPALDRVEGAREDGTHLWFPIASLREMARMPRDPSWPDRFDAMIRFAASKGWVDETGSRVRAHLVRG